MNPKLIEDASIQRSELRKLASEATAGEWEVWTSNSVRRITASGKQDGGVLSAVTTRDGMPDLHGNNRERDLTYIAAANPQTVIDLLDQLDRAEAELERLRGRLHDRCTCEHGDPSRRLVEHDKDCPIRVNIRTRIAPEVAIDRLAAALSSSDEVDGLEEQLAACRAALGEMTAARDEACDLALHYSTFTARDQRDELDSRVEELRSVGQPK